MSDERRPKFDPGLGEADVQFPDIAERQLRMQAYYTWKEACRAKERADAMIETAQLEIDRNGTLSTQWKRFEQVADEIAHPMQLVDASKDGARQ